MASEPSWVANGLAHYAFVVSVRLPASLGRGVPVVVML